MSSLFGGGSKTPRFPMGGTKSVSDLGRFTVTNRLDQFGNQTSSRFKNLNDPAVRAESEFFGRTLGKGGDFAKFRSTITPGFSKLREARLAQVANARRRGLGSLRSNLARRGVGGSSFAGDALIAAERDFGELAAEQEAQSFLEELEANFNTIRQESQVLMQQTSISLQEAGLSAEAISGMQRLMQQDMQFRFNAETEALRSRQAARGDLLGAGLTLAGTAIGASKFGQGIPASSGGGSVSTGMPQFQFGGP